MKASTRQRLADAALTIGLGLMLTWFFFAAAGSVTP